MRLDLHSEKKEEEAAPIDLSSIEVEKKGKEANPDEEGAAAESSEQKPEKAPKTEAKN